MTDPLKPSDIEDTYNSACEHSTNALAEALAAQARAEADTDASIRVRDKAYEQAAFNLLADLSSEREAKDRAEAAVRTLAADFLQSKGKVEALRAERDKAREWSRLRDEDIMKLGQEVGRLTAALERAEAAFQATRCPIGLDDSREICSAGCCFVCRGERLAHALAARDEAERQRNEERVARDAWWRKSETAEAKLAEALAAQERAEAERDEAEEARDIQINCHSEQARERGKAEAKLAEALAAKERAEAEWDALKAALAEAEDTNEFQWTDLKHADERAQLNYARAERAEAEVARLTAALAGAREECAKVAEDWDTGGHGEHRNMVIAQRASSEIAAAIRALGTKDNG